MADAVTTELDPVQAARLARALNELQRYTNRDCFQSVMYASQKIAQSARAVAKPGQSQRQIIANPAFTMRKDRKALMRRDKFSGYPFMFPIDTQGGRKWWYTFQKTDPLRKVPRHGLSRIMWNNLASAASEKKRSTGEGGDSGSSKTDFSVFTWFSSVDVAMAGITNLLSYQETAYPGITNKAVTNGTNALNYQINKALGITVDRANRP
jgi:hypothetical protein